MRSIAASAACCLIIGLCAVLAGKEMLGIAERLPARKPQERLPAFGQADIAYFSEPTCPACRRAAPTVAALERRYPRHRFAHLNTATTAGIALEVEYFRAYHVPRRDQGSIPIAFAGRRYFLGTHAISHDLPAYLQAALLVRPPSDSVPGSAAAPSSLNGSGRSEPPPSSAPARRRAQGPVRSPA